MTLRTSHRCLGRLAGLVCLGTAVLVFGADTVLADGHGGREHNTRHSHHDDDDDHDHDRARQAVVRGEIKPLAEILTRLAKDLPGRVIGVDLEREGGRYVYELTVVSADGRVREVNVDARSAVILGEDFED